MLKAYLEKSETALKSMKVNAEAGITEWAVSASYYARYFAVYGLLSKLGVKCEIHDCTIALFGYLFRDSVPRELIEELRESKDQRVEIQYYSPRVEVDLKDVMGKTRRFVLEVEKIIDGLSSGKITALERKLKTLASSRKRG